MKTQKNWTRVTLFVVLALTSLSSVAMSAPHRLKVLAVPVAVESCVEDSGITRFGQYQDALRWTEGNATVPMDPSFACGEDSQARFGQYQTATEQAWLDANRAPWAGVGIRSIQSFAQYQTATEQAWIDANRAPWAGVGAGSGDRWQQYQTVTQPSFGVDRHEWNRWGQYQEATGWDR